MKKIEKQKNGQTGKKVTENLKKLQTVSSFEGRPWLTVHICGRLRVILSKFGPSYAEGRIVTDCNSEQ